MGHLKYVLAKIEIAELLKLETSRDQLFEQLRSNYPVADPVAFEEVREFSFDLKTGSQNLNNAQSNAVLVFKSADENWSIRIAPKAIFLHTASYVDFKEFIDRFSSILTIVDSIFEINYFKFCGMRYINRYKVGKNNSFTYAIKEYLTQPDLDPTFQRGGSNLTAAYVINGNNLTVNSGVAMNGRVIPDALIAIAKDVIDINEVLDGPWAHLDLDSTHTPEKLIKFDLATVRQKFTELRDNADKAYTICSTQAE